MIYHLTDATRWRRSLSEGRHTASTRDVELADEGFIHCSTATQWQPVRDRYYQGVDDLVLLYIDESRLPSRPVYEQLGSATEPFPHVYGPIPVDAVIFAEPL